MEQRAIVVGVQRGQPAAVVRCAAALAERIQVGLVLVHVVEDSGFVGDLWADLSAFDENVDLPSDRGPSSTEDPTEALRAELAIALWDSDVAWRMEPMSGDPADALARVADRLDAPMIVVGTREPEVGRTVYDFFTGSVAAHLSHRQSRPVLVVPVRPVSRPADLPWAGDDGALDPLPDATPCGGKVFAPHTERAA